jgi:hypothetical protein
MHNICRMREMLCVYEFVTRLRDSNTFESNKITVRSISVANILATTDLLLPLIKILKQVQKVIESHRIHKIYIKMKLVFLQF